MALLSSRDNPVIKDYVRLCSAKSFRASSGRFAIEGARLCEDALCSGVKLENAFMTQDACAKYKEISDSILNSGAQVYEITPAVASKMADTQNPQGIFCTAFMLDKAPVMGKIDISGGYIALENLQDPGNLGTVLRTAEALGLDGVLLSADCVDIYSPKVLRGAMGAVFRIPFLITDDLPATLKTLSNRGMKTVAAVVQGEACSILEAAIDGGIVIAVGNEGVGLTDECIDACMQRVTIPMAGHAQSLNASTAASILMWEIFKSRKTI
jgi:TrmH family RNA methyltransferase